MTSHQSSANKNAVRYDFKTALKSSIFPSVITFLSSVLMFVLVPLDIFMMYYDKVFKFEELRSERVIALTGMGNGEYAGLYFLALGVLFALFSFAFVMKKKAVNVFFSIGIDRRTLYKNRILSSVLMIASATAIPIILDIAINIFFLGNARYIIECGIALFAECFVYTLTGFAVTAVAMTLCTTFIESLFFAAAVIGAPSAVVYFADAMCSAYLRGYNRNDLFSYTDNVFAQPSLFHETSIINPLLIGKAYGANYSVEDNIFNFVNRHAEIFNLNTSVEDSHTIYYDTYGYGYHNYGLVRLGFDYILPLIVWSAVCICLIFIARQLFIKIKAENAGVHGSRIFASVFFAGILSIGIFAFWTDAVYYAYDSLTEMQNIVVSVLIGLAIMVVSYFIVMSVCKRTIRHKAKSFAVPACLLVFVIASVSVLTTGGLGYSVYVPEVDKIEKAIITSSATDSASNEFLLTPSKNSYVDDIFTKYFSDGGMGVYTDEEDLKLFTDINKKLTVQTDNMAGSAVCVYYQLKNGEIISRRYDTTDYDAAYSILSLRDSKAAREELEYLLTGTTDDLPMTKKMKDTALSPYFMFYSGNEQDASNVIKGGRVYAVGSDGMINGNLIKNTPELREALLADLLSQTYEQRFRPTERAVGGLFFSSYDHTNMYNDNYSYTTDYLAEELGQMVADSPYEGGYYIYPSMTNTISYLKSTGEYDLLTGENEILSVTVKKCGDVRSEQFEERWGNNASVSYLFSAINQNIEPDENTDMYWEYDDEEGYYDTVNGYKMKMSDLFEDGKTIDDSGLISEIMRRARAYYYAQDEDYIILVRYENSEETAYLVPAAAMAPILQ